MNSDKKTARIAGLLYLLVAVFSSFALITRSSLIVPGNAAATANNITASEMLFRFSFMSDLLGQTFHVLLVLALFMLLRTVDKNQALLMAVLGLVPVPIAMLNQLNQFAALSIINNSDYMKTFSADQMHSQVMFFLNQHGQGVLIAQIFWGLWLFPLGYLVFRSGFIPKILGILLMVAGLGYVTDCIGKFLIPNYNITISSFTFIGELLLTFWLLIMGVKAQKGDKRNSESS